MVQGQRHTLGGSRLTIAILAIGATLWGIAATAGTLRNGLTTSAQVSGALPGPILWTYYDTSIAPEVTTFASAGAGDDIITLINPNGSANSNLGPSAINTCAMIYVFDDDQEMGACCGCPLTPAGIETFSVENDFTSNWGISGAEGNGNSSGSIAIVAVGTNVSRVLAGPLSNGTFCPSSQSGACNSGCDPTIRPGYSVSNAANLLGSIVHNQSIRTGSGIVAIQTGLTETALFDNGGGDPTNLAYLQAQCGALVGNDTGGGICKCPRPDPDAAPSPHITAIATSTGTATATPTATPTPAGKLVFVTSSGFFGNLGGTAGGDTDCNNAASAAGLPGTYKAWLSTAAAGDNPASSFTQSTIPYVLVDNTQVAANWTALVSGTLDHAIDEDEHGTMTTQSSVWTGTNANGTAPTYPQQVLDCFGWSDQTDLAYVGSPTATNSTWSIQEGIVCNNFEPLYCFQQ